MVYPAALSLSSLTSTFSGTVLSPALVPASVPALSAFPLPGRARVPVHVDPPELGVEHEPAQDDLGAGREPVLGDQEDAVLLPFPCDGPLGNQGEVLTLPELRNRSRDILGEVDWGALGSFINSPGPTS